MKRHLLIGHLLLTLVVVCGIGLSLGATSAATSSEAVSSIPSVYYEDGPVPVWVSAALLEADPSQISEEHWGDLLEWNRRYQSEDGECHQIRMTARQHAVVGRKQPRILHTSLKSAWREADWVSVMVVKGAEAGFGDGLIPGTLIQLEVVRMLKGGVSPLTRFLFYPSGEMDLSGNSICVRSVDLPPVPKPGSRIILFSVGGSDSVLLSDWDWLTIVTSDSEGDVILPEWSPGTHVPDKIDSLAAELEGVGK